MVKKAILLLSTVAGFIGATNAQVCGTDEVYRESVLRDPKVAEIQKAMDMKWRKSMAKTTAVNNYLEFLDSAYAAETSTKLIVPTVVHVVHDYGTEYVTDNEIFQMMDEVNKVYLKQNADTAAVIAPFKRYIGDANIEFRLARKDPQGNPTIGIIRHHSNTTAGGDEQAKVNQWAPNRYLNIWIEKVIGRATAGGTILAYSVFPSTAAQDPYTDGVITAAPYITGGTKTMAHEIGHYLNLAHVWNSSQQGAGTAGACGDDEVDDTPPTIGHPSGCALYDTTCATGYKKGYPFLPPGATSPIIDTVDYPDTVNTQNIMDYSNCPAMFTKQQVMRMRDALQSPVGNRNQLITTVSQTATGVLDPANDLAPIADFSVEWKNVNPAVLDRGVYMCPGREFTFKNQSWRDTIQSVEWSFSNGGSIKSTGNQMTAPIKVEFTEPGWATVTLSATSANTGSNTIQRQAVYVADPNYKLQPNNGYFQEFDENGDAAKWPAFNYFNNATGWIITKNTGYYDNYSIQYTGYDMRFAPHNRVNSVAGDFDDFFTPAFDLSGMTSGDCNLNFMSSGVFRTSNSALMNDRLEIHYSIDCGNTWKIMDTLTKGKLANKGSYELPYAPTWQGDWKLQSMNIPAAARTSNTFFRFRYKPSVNTAPGQYEVANGNNFYIDRINVSPFPLGVNTMVNEKNNIAVAPNPTNGNSFVMIQGATGKTANVVVTDMTGKVVYRTEAQLTSQLNRIEIPASAIAVKGIYMVQVVTGERTHTEKLVSY